MLHWWGIDYFRWRVVSLTAIALTLCFRGYWNGRQRTHQYLQIIVAVHLLNVAVSAGLIYGLAGLPTMGANGAGAGTSLSLFAGLIVWCWISRKSITRQLLLIQPPRVVSLCATFLPLAWWVGIGLEHGLLGIWLMQLLYRLINSAGFLWVWQRRRWLVPVF